MDSQKIIRKLVDPVTATETHTTDPGPTGILVNGVEILNYKSNDSIFYGSIQDVEVVSKGEDYGYYQPPILQTNDSVGAGFSAFCGITGSLGKIDVLDPGFDYVTIPTIRITGGSGKGAVAQPILKSISHSKVLIQFKMLDWLT